MAGLKWTPEQQRAIETRGKNLLVSAGAGAGKTAVLVERIMRLITHPAHPVDINHILVVTFTNAAAEEMRNRISSALHAALRGDPGSALLNRQIALLEQASITTMHSFCLDTVRRYFYLIDMDPAFRVGDEHELSLLRLDVLTALFEDRYGNPETAAGFTRLVEIYGGERGDLALQDLVFRLYEFVRSTPRPRHWFAAALERWDVDETQALDDCAWVKDLRCGLQLKLEHAHALLRRALEIAQMPEGPTAYLDLLPSEVNAARRLVRGDYTWAQLGRQVKSVEFKRLPPSRGGDKGLREQVQKLRNQARKILRNMADTYFAHTPEGWVRDMRGVHSVLCDLVDLTIAFDRAFTNAKRNRGLVDFSDLEHLCLRILSTRTEEALAPSAVARELRDWYQEIMVDEYQDINGIQETILKMIKRPEGGPGNLFLVGDVKQSIYRFRLAEPDLFLHKYHTYPRAPEHAGGTARIDLTRNFRSRPAIIDAVNDVFGRIMTTETGEIDYDDSAQLNFGAKYPDVPLASGTGAEPVELHVIDRAVETTADAGVYQAAEAEALLAVSRIKALVEGAPGQKPGQVYDRRLQGYRPLTFSDIVVLLRSPAGQANTFVEVFHRAGVPVCADLGAGYFAAVEVEAMFSLLSIIDNPHQDIPLAGVLRAPWCGFDARDLAAIRTARTDGDFYTCVQAAATRENPLGARLRAFLSRLGEWRTFARRKPLPELIWQIYRETGYYEFVGGLPGGAQRQANLRALHNRARRYEQTTYRGLFRFLRFMERVREKGDDLGAAQPLGENEDVVRIMSVHRSKGLEFPVVFLAGLGKQFNFRDCHREVLLHKELGLATDVINPEVRLRYPTLFKYLVRDRLKAESLAEEMRILYVALTRARERLVLIGSGEPDRLFRTGGHGACPVLQRMNILEAKSFLQWITLALGEHPAALEKGTHCGPWVINIVNPAGLVGEADMSARPQADPAVVARLRDSQPVRTGEMQEDIARRLQWRYGWLPETVRPVKLTATELHRRRELVVGEAAPLKSYRPYLVRKPRCLQETAPLTASEYGTAVHLVLQHIDWDAVTTEDVQWEIQRMTAREMISENQAGAVDAALIARFLQSGLAARIRNGKAFRREVPFTLRLPAVEFYPDVQADEWVLVQGVIDGLLTEGDGFVIIDYKTDRVPPKGARIVADRYRSQLDLYARAVETITGDRVKEKYIYLFDTETTIQL